MLGVFRRLFGLRKERNTALSTVLDGVEFEDSLIREKARSYRTDLPFALVAFQTFQEPRIAKARYELTHLLATIICERVRIIDTVGWRGAQLSALLPHARGADANGFIRSVDKIYMERAPLVYDGDDVIPEIVCDIFVFERGWNRVEEEALEPAEAIERSGAVGGTGADVEAEIGFVKDVLPESQTHRKKLTGSE